MRTLRARPPGTGPVSNTVTGTPAAASCLARRGAAVHFLARGRAFMRDPAPLSKAIDAIERGIERRAARVWAPRWIGPLLALRGVVQPLTERSLTRDPTELREAIRLVDPASGELPEQDPALGVAAAALTPPARTPIPR